MANYEWFQAGGRRILFMDVASENAEELKAKLDQFVRVIRTQPENSLLTISDVTNGNFDKTMKRLLQTFVKGNTPYIKMSVLIGVEGLQKVIYNGVLRATGRNNLVIKDSMDEAIAFLTELTTKEGKAI